MVGKPDKALRSLGHVLHRPVIASSLAACYRAVRSRLTPAAISLLPSPSPAISHSSLKFQVFNGVETLSISFSPINENHLVANVAVWVEFACPECPRAKILTQTIAVQRSTLVPLFFLSLSLSFSVTH